MTEQHESTRSGSGRHGNWRKRRLLIRSTAAGMALVIGASTKPAIGEGVGVLTIRARGFTDAGGHPVAKLFAPGDNVLSTGRWQLSSTIEEGVATFRFQKLPAGVYAAVVFHDKNDNGVIDHGLLGPSEPLGFSGGFQLSLLSGRPDFERLKFDFKPPAQLLEVIVR